MLTHPVYVVAELSMVMPLPPPPRGAYLFWVASQLFADLIWLFWFASVSALNLLSQTNLPFDRLIARGLILKHEVQVGKTWLVQVQRAFRTKFTTSITSEEVSLVFSGERQQKESSTCTLNLFPRWCLLYFLLL